MQGNKNQQQGNKNQQHKQNKGSGQILNHQPATANIKLLAGCTARMSNVKTPEAMGHTCHAGFVACIGNARLPRKSGERPPRIEACPQGCRNMLLGPHLWDHGCSALASQASCACQMIAGIMVAMPRPQRMRQ